MANVKHIIYTYGLTEAEIGSRLAEPLMNENPTVDLVSEAGEVSIVLQATAYNNDEAEALCEPIIEYICDHLSYCVCGIDSTLEEKVVNLLRDHRMTISFAESCTAGMLSGRLTRVSGVSDVYECGFTTYSHDMKHLLLGVPEDLLKEQGAVCPEVAKSMAVGCRRIADSSLGLSITGVAGPSTSDGKDVGTVYIALTDGKRVWIKELSMPGQSRDEIRQAATSASLDLIRRYLEALPGMMAGSQPVEIPSSEKIIEPQEVKKTSLADKILPWRAEGKAALIRISAIWLLLIAILIVAPLLSYKLLFVPLHNEQIYDNLEKTYNTPVSEDGEIDTSKYPDGMLNRFYALYDLNEDVRGWLKISGTNISYPVMDSRNSDYYASHTFKKKASDYGVPYFDSHADFSSPTAVNTNLVVYGNRTEDGQMFSELTEYRQESFLLEHQWISLDTMYATGKWQVCAVFYADATNNNVEFDYTQNTFADSEQHKAFLKELCSRSIYKMPYDLKETDQLLFISTDYTGEENTFENERLVVVAKKVDYSVTDSYGPAVVEKEFASKALTKMEVNPDVLMPNAYYLATSGSTATKKKITTTTVATTTEATTEASTSVATTTSATTTTGSTTTAKPVTTTATPATTRKTTVATTVPTTISTTRPTTTAPTTVQTTEVPPVEG